MRVIVRRADRIVLTFRWIGALFVELVWRAGNLLRAGAGPYHLATSCGGDGGGGGGGAAPCSCPAGLSNTYTVSGFGGLTACSTCDASSDLAWPGTVYRAGAGCLWWAIDPDFDSFSIGGKALDITYTQILLRTNVTPCRWELYVACFSGVNPTKTLWAGYKTTGSTPAGTYSFVSSDCGNTTATMSVA